MRAGLNDISNTEWISISSLIFYAVSNERFFDWEMPTLMGLNRDQFFKLAKKLKLE